MPKAIIAAANAAAWAGKSLVDSTVPEERLRVVMNNSLAAVAIAGIDAGQRGGETWTFFNRGTFNIAFGAEDTTAPAKDRFVNAATLIPGRKVQAYFNGNRWEIFTDGDAGKMGVDSTVTPGGTNGAQTINKPSGTINIAAAGTSVVLTNSLITAASVVLAVLRTADGTAKSVVAVPGAGTCTFTLNAAATGAVSIGFLVVN